MVEGGNGKPFPEISGSPKFSRRKESVGFAHYSGNGGLSLGQKDGLNEGGMVTLPV